MKGLIHKRRTLLQEREMLKNYRMPYIYGQVYDPTRGFVAPEMPPHLVIRMNLVDADLRIVEHELLQELLKLSDRLPTCEECGEKASHRAKGGPFFCTTHAREHPTAVEVEWLPSLKALFGS